MAVSTVAGPKRRGWRRQLGGRSGTIANRAAGDPATRPAPYSPNGLPSREHPLSLPPSEALGRIRDAYRDYDQQGVRCNGPPKPPTAALACDVPGGRSGLADLAVMTPTKTGPSGAVATPSRRSLGTDHGEVDTVEPILSQPTPSHTQWAELLGLVRGVTKWRVGTIT